MTSKPLDLDDCAFVKAGDMLVQVSQIKRVDISNIEREFVVLHTEDGEYIARGFDAIEVVMALKASAVEGRRMKWRKNAWAFHNFIGHPVVQVLAWMGLKKAAIRFHDYTTPSPRSMRDSAGTK